MSQQVVETSDGGTEVQHWSFLDGSATQHFSGYAGFAIDAQQSPLSRESAAQHSPEAEIWALLEFAVNGPGAQQSSLLEAFAAQRSVEPVASGFGLQQDEPIFLRSSSDNSLAKAREMISRWSKTQRRSGR